MEYDNNKIINFKLIQKKTPRNDLEPEPFTWEIRFNKIQIFLCDPIPSRVQRWMMKKCFGIEIIILKNNRW